MTSKPDFRETWVHRAMDDLEKELYTFQWAYPDMGNNRGELEVDRDKRELVLVVWVPDNDTPEDPVAKPLRVSQPVTHEDPQIQIRDLIHNYLCHEADEQMWFNGIRVFYPHEQPATLSPEEQELAEMRKIYPYATLEAHMLVDGQIMRRCGVCGNNPVPKNAGSVMWCDPCVDECVASSESLEEFVTRKRAENG